MMTKELLRWLIPPIMGGFIGFVTNVIAIRMLFRPLKQIRVFGIPLPLTPGILPRERHKLAISIGDMVERELLTPDLLSQRFHNEEFRESLKKAITRYTRDFLSRPLCELGLGGDKTAGFSGFINRFIGDFLNSPNGQAILEQLTANLITAAGQMSISDIIEEEKLKEKLEKIIRDGLSRHASFISSRLRSLLDKSYNGAVGSIISFLKQPQMHSELEIHGKIFLSNTILKLNVFQRFFISATQYDRTLHDRMPEIIDDLVNQLEEFFIKDENKKRVNNFIGSRAEFYLKNNASLDDIIKIVSSLPSPYLNMTVSELLKQWTHDDIYVLGKKLLEFVKSFFNKEKQTGFSLSLKDILDKNRNSSIAFLFSINETKKEAIDDFITRKILETADRNISAILDNINIKNVVVERIDSLDMLKVEGIVLGVMADKLKWIDLFGGIIGFIIGVFQVIFTHLMS